MSDRDAFGNFNPTTLTTPVATEVRGSWDLWDKAAGLFMVLLFVVPFAIGGWFAWTTLHDARSGRSTSRR